MINREKLEQFMFELDKGECNTCGKKCKNYFCSKECEEAFNELKEVITTL